MAFSKTASKMTLSETIEIVRDFVIFLGSGSLNAIKQKRISAKTKMLDDLFSVFTKIQNIVAEMITSKHQHGWLKLALMVVVKFCSLDYCLFHIYKILEINL